MRPEDKLHTFDPNKPTSHRPRGNQGALSNNHGGGRRFNNHGSRRAVPSYQSGWKRSR